MSQVQNLTTENTVSAEFLLLTKYFNYVISHFLKYLCDLRALYDFKKTIIKDKLRAVTLKKCHSAMKKSQLTIGKCEMAARKCKTAEKKCHLTIKKCEMAARKFKNLQFL